MLIEMLKAKGEKVAQKLPIAKSHTACSCQTKPGGCCADASNEENTLGISIAKPGKGKAGEPPAADAEKQGWAPGATIPLDPLRWGSSFDESAPKLLQNTQLRRNIAHATTTIRNKRALRVEEMPDWEDLRLAASAVKRNVQANLPVLLEQFEANVKARGGIVHWAQDGAEACEIIKAILQEKQCDDVVKVKSMATQEINMNETLAEAGISAWETDLAELIVQLADDMPSHVVVPAVHRNRAEVKAIFQAKMGDAPEDLTAEPRRLAMAARAHLRRKFLNMDVAISGTNMGIAETGTVSIFESEGNGRMCLTLANTLVTVMGIEKLVPSYQDAEIFAQLLPRSATGERMNPYTSMWTGITPGDGPKEFHLILLDNGRSTALADPVGHEALSCIRCGACLNICPVYEAVGGHAYNSVYPGPIGISLTPQLKQSVNHSDPNSTLPFACSLCNACADACPAHIDLPGIIVDNRRKFQDANRGHIPTSWDIGMKAASVVMRSGRNMKLAGRAATLGRPLGGKTHKIGHIPLPMASSWTDVHDVPAPPAKTFRQWWDEQESEK